MTSTEKNYIVSMNKKKTHNLSKSVVCFRFENVC